MDRSVTREPAPDAIDFVYTWVDGEKNAALRAQYAAALAGDSNPASPATRGVDDMRGQNRFRDNREIVQSIASVRRFAPFVRRIFIVAADGQVPDWWNATDYPEVEVVPHSRVFGEQHEDMLPTFNSHAIEAMLPFVPGLAERFVYFNDDMFLGAPVKPTDFFDRDGTAIVRVSGQVTASWQHHQKAWRVYRGNMFAALQAKFSGHEVYDTAHQARTLLKSACLKTWEDDHFRELLRDTARDRFRGLSNLPPIELFSNVMLIERTARLEWDKGVVLQLFDRTVFGPEFAALNAIQPRFYCINDDMRAPSQRHLEALQGRLRHDLPHHPPASPDGGSLRRPRPRLGAALREVAHKISWLNRMRGRLIDALFSRRQ
jgi:hypothetical protein